MDSAEVSQVTQYLTFTLGEEDFALNIVQVREVLNYTTITKVPRMPEFLCGVINLRGNVVPVIDLCMKMVMTSQKRVVDTCIVIVEIEKAGELTQMGVLVDSVKEVIDLDPTEISPPPKLGTKLKSEFIKGMGKQGEKFLIILDIERILSDEELAMLINESEENRLKEESTSDITSGLAAEMPVEAAPEKALAVEELPSPAADAAGSAAA